MKRLLRKLTGSAGGYHVHINHSAGLVAGIVRVQLETRDPTLSRQPVDFAIELIGNSLLERATHAATLRRREVMRISSSLYQSDLADR